MRLSDLQARFLTIVDDRTYHFGDPPDVTLAQAQGIMFLCPKCFLKNGGARGTHVVLCWFRERGVADDRNPKPGRWTPAGTGIEDLTFVPGEPPIAVSVRLTGDGCKSHFKVVQGGITNLE